MQLGEAGQSGGVGLPPDDVDDRDGEDDVNGEDSEDGDGGEGLLPGSICRLKEGQQGSP